MELRGFLYLKKITNKANFSHGHGHARIHGHARGHGTLGDTDTVTAGYVYGLGWVQSTRIYQCIQKKIKLTVEI